jgi:predicted  nucleic acid-binding Zn-ribbon protein
MLVMKMVCMMRSIHLPTQRCAPQENDLLVAQQSELDGEIQRLQAQLRDQAAAAVSMAQENAAMMARVQQHVSGAAGVEARHSRMQAALSAAESRILVLEQALAEAQASLVRFYA